MGPGDEVLAEQNQKQPHLVGGEPGEGKVPQSGVFSIADGMTSDEIITELPDLEAEDVAEALRYTAETVRAGAITPGRPDQI